MNEPRSHQPDSIRRHPRGLLAGLAALAAASALATSAAPASASTYVFTPVADARVNAASPDTNYGSGKAAVVDGSPLNRDYLRFDVVGLQGTVTSATLSLYALADGGGVDVRTVADDSWSERRITFDNAPPVGPVAASSEALVAGSRATIDAAALVPGDGVISMALTTASTVARKVGTREVSAQTPQLIVTTSAPDDPVIAAAGDIACDPDSSLFNGGAGTTSACRQMATSNLMVGRGLAAVLPLGDLQYEDATASAFSASYDPSWGRLAALSHPVPGDKEYRQAGAYTYFDYWNGPGIASGPAGERGEGYYSYDLGSWHVIALNSRCDQIGGCGQGSPEESWLAADLAAHPASCILAYMHHPLFTSSGRDPENPQLKPLWQDLYAAHADVVLAGGDHAYERFARQDPDRNPDPVAGIREIVAGTGGAGHPGSKVRTRPNSGVRNATTFGVVELTLRPGSYDWRFVPESRGTFADAGSDSCTAPTSDGEPPARPAAPAAGNVTAHRVDLTWPATTDNDGVALYTVLRDGTEIGTTAGSSLATAFSDAGAQPGRTYSYSLVAQDAVGNRSQESPPTVVTTPNR